MNRVILWALAALLMPAVASAIHLDLPEPPLAGMDRGAILERIEQLETAYDLTPPDERADLAFELGQLYAATQMPKHAPTAQRYLDEVTRLDPARADAVYLSATELCRSTYYDLALARMLDLVALQPESLDHLLMLARLEFVASRERVYKIGFDRSYQLYVNCLGRAPDNDEALYGAAATALLVENYRLARSCAAHLRKQHPDWPEPWLIGAAAQFRLDNREQAWVDFLQGIARSEPEVRSTFLGARALVLDEALVPLARTWIDPERARTITGAAPRKAIDWFAVVEDPGIRAELVEIWWARLDDTPEAFENESELDYWTRLVEADLRFGEPRNDKRGWETLTGEIWARMGQPLSEYHWMGNDPTFSPMTQVIPRPYLKIEGGPERYRQSLVLLAPRRFWIWFYLVDGMPQRLILTDWTYGTPNWGISPGSDVDLGVLRNELTYVQPSRKRPLPPFRLNIELSRFARGDDSLVETAIAVEAVAVADPVHGAPDSLLMEWTLFDERSEVVDQIVRPLPPATSLSELMLASGQPSYLVGADPRLALVGATIPAGDYQVRVRAIDPATGRYSGQTVAVRIPVAGKERHLSLSSIQLSHGMPVWDPKGRLPLEFVKHGRAFISAPRAIIEGNRLGVHYEVNDLARDESGRTRFDVEYAIYEGTGQVRLLAMLGDFDPDAVEEVELATVEYLREQTDVSRHGYVVKGTEIDISDLHAGDYVLRVRINDLISGEECASAVAFRRPAWSHAD